MKTFKDNRWLNALIQSNHFINKREKINDEAGSFVDLSGYECASIKYTQCKHLNHDWQLIIYSNNKMVIIPVNLGDSDPGKILPSATSLAGMA